MQRSDRFPAHQAILDRLRFNADRPSLIRPSYDGYGITNVPWTVLDALGVAHPGTGLAPELVPEGLLEGVDAVLVIVADALGYGQLAAAMRDGDAPALAALTKARGYVPLSSTFPSTTAAALTALQTGVPPSKHGMVGYTLYLREFGSLTNLIRFGPLGRFDSYARSEVEPRTFLPVPTIYDRVAEAGIPAEMVNFRPFEHTAFTRIHAEGVPYRTYDTLGEFVTAIRRAVEQPGPRLVVAYWPMIDIIDHRYGPQSETALAELRLLDAAIGAELIGRIKRDDLLVVFTADHGQIQLDPSQTISLNRQPDLLDDLIVPPAGERRLVYFYPRPGREEAVAERLIELAGDRGWVLRSDELIDEGFFGPTPVYQELRSRIGTLTLVAHGPATFPYDAPGERATPMLGAHGALEAEEMLVPGILWRA